MGFWSWLFGRDADTQPAPVPREDDTLNDAERTQRRKELLKRIRRMEIITRRVVNEHMAGSYHSAFKGQGMNFDEVRLYQPGDDVRFIDWNVSARMGEPYIKKFTEERELTVFLLVDASASLLFGTGERSKQDACAELAALIAFSAIKNNDRIGLIIFTDEVELFVPPKKGRKHVLRVIREVLEFRPKSPRTNLSVALETLNRVSKRSCVAFLVSDFLDTNYRRPLLVASRRHDLIPLVVQDPAENELPALGTVTVEDPETGERFLVDTLSASGRREFNRIVQKRAETQHAMFRKMGVEAVHMRTDQSFHQPLVNYFKLRAKRH